MNFAELIRKREKDSAEKTALIFRDLSFSFRQLSMTASQVSGGLASLGIGRGDKIAIFLPNIPEYLYSFIAIFLLRGVCVPLDFMLTEEEVINFVNHSQSALLIAQEKKNIDFSRIKANCPSLRTIVLFSPAQEQPGFLPWEQLLKEKAVLSSIETKDNDPAAIFYTSGSTGHPKGVLLSYGHLSNPLECFEYFLHPTPQDSLICAGVPFSHIAGLDYVLFMLYFGITLVLMERFQPLEFLKYIEKYKATIFCIVPSMYVAVLSLKEYDKFNLSSLRYAVVFGAPSSPVLLERFHKVCPNAYLLNGWGMTETAAPNSFLPTGTRTKEILHTGKFIPGTEAKIVDDEGDTLGDEQDGELWIRGKAVMLEYYREPELTRQVLTEDRWLRTGDIARRDALGRYIIVGRKKEMIKVSGEIVFCPEVEEVIHRHPKVKEVAVIGVPDKLRGEVPKACIVPKEQEELSEEELRYFLKQHLAHFKIPHHFEFFPALPKNRVGKIDKERLKTTV